MLARPTYKVESFPDISELFWTTFKIPLRCVFPLIPTLPLLMVVQKQEQHGLKNMETFKIT